MKDAALPGEKLAEPDEGVASVILPPDTAWLLLHRSLLRLFASQLAFSHFHIACSAVQRILSLGLKAQSIHLASLLLLLSRPRAAWLAREDILKVDGRPDEARRFLQVAQAYDHRAITVTEAAAQIAVSMRQLYRLSLVELSYPPGIVLGLFRIASVARDLCESSLTPAVIARVHAFCDQSAMNRQFARYVGMSPRSYRSGFVLIQSAAVPRSVSSRP